MTISCNMAMLW